MFTNSARLGDKRHSARHASSTGRAEYSAFSHGAGGWKAMSSLAACSKLAMISTPGMPLTSWDTGVVYASPRPVAQAPTSTYLPRSCSAGTSPRRTDR